MSPVVAALGYLKPTTERPYDYACEPPSGLPWQNYETSSQRVGITDARDLLVQPTLENEGFVLRNAPSWLTDYADEAAIRAVYYRECADLACAVTGASKAHVFDHLVRKREADRPALTFGRRVAGNTPAANGRVHNDYTEDSGRRRLGLVLGDRVEARGIQRYGIVNIWRSIAGPAIDTPLAVCDARTVSATDLVPSDVHYASRTGEIYLVEHSPRHRWLYYSAMDRHEALIFKQYDSLVSGVPRFVPHAAFDHPHTPVDAPLRESIEVRCLVVYEG